MTSKPRLFIHLGTHRTATTSIQAVLFSNREKLLSKGIIYPFNVRRHNEQIKNIVAKRITVAEFSAKILEQIAGEKAPIHTVIISDEDISCIKDLSIFDRLKERFDLHFIMFLRRQDLWLESWYMQNIKWQFNKKYSNLTFSDFYALRQDFFWINYESVIKRMETIVDKENIHLSTFEKFDQPNGPVEAFCHIVGIEVDSDIESVGQRNSSMSPLMTEFVRHLPLYKAKRQFRGFIERACAQVDKEMGLPKASALYIPHAERVRLMAEFESGNAEVASRYFDRKLLFLDPLPPSDSPLADTKLPVSADELLEKFVGPLIGRMIDARNLQHQAGEAAKAKEGR